MENKNFDNVSGLWKCYIGVCALLLVTCSTMTSSQECLRDDRANTTLDKVTGSGVMVRELEGSVTSAEECASLCCQLQDSEGCTVASFLIYYGSPLCMLASCHPISDCVMSDYPGSFTSIIGLPVNSSAPSSSPPPFIYDVIIDILSDVIQNTSDVHTTSIAPPTSATTTTATATTTATTTTTVATRVEDEAVDNLDLDVMSTTTTTTAPLQVNSETTTWYWDEWWWLSTQQSGQEEDKEDSGEGGIIVEDNSDAETGSRLVIQSTTTTAMTEIANNGQIWELDSIEVFSTGEGDSEHKAVYTDDNAKDNGQPSTPDATAASGAVVVPSVVQELQDTGDVRVSGDVENANEDKNEQPEVDEEEEQEMHSNDVIQRDEDVDQSELEERRQASVLDSMYVTIATVIIVTSAVVMVIMLLRRLQRAKRLHDYEKCVRHM